jgi:hypothetical protein
MSAEDRFIEWQVWCENENRFTPRPSGEAASTNGALAPEVYESAIASFQRGLSWDDRLGAAPGQPGCLVPTAVLEKFKVGRAAA